METNAEDPKVGLLLSGRYRVLKKLGEGGMGAVYEAHHELIGKRLALKCLHPQFMSNREVVERFYREANAATAVGNEHIIEVSDVGKFDDGSPFIIMEFLEGVEFGKLLDTLGSLPVGRLVHIVTQVCEALGAAHARGIVHRDMKPENVYLVKRGAESDFVKVLDFGISKMKESNESLSGGGSLTKTGTALGTPYYMPPEQAQGLRDVDHRADIYAVGVILYQGLTGRLPFDADSYPALMVKIMTDTPLPIGQLRSDVPAELAAVVTRAMCRDRAQRFQSTAELAQALRPFRELDQAPIMLASARPAGSEETTPFGWSEPARTTEKRPASGGRGLLIGGGVGAMVVIGALVAMFGSRSPAVEPEPAAAALAPAAPVPAAVPQPVAPEPVPQVQQALPMGIAVPPKPTEVQVSIKASPGDARIYIGEVEFPNPMDAWRPRSLDPVRIRVEASGHKTTEQLAIFDQDRKLEFTLEKGKGVKHLESMRAGNAAAPTAPVAVAPAPSEAPVVSVRPVARPEPAPTPEPAPSEEVYKGPTGRIRSEF
jgi:tRNA A-37 threonylcarbamoyl transferase component Bud32